MRCAPNWTLNSKYLAISKTSFTNFGCQFFRAMEVGSREISSLIRRVAVLTRCQVTCYDLATGQHRNPTNQTAYFTTAYFHRPEELAAEVREASFADCQIFAVEGPVWSTAHLGEAWDDPVQRKSLMEFLALIERESSAHGASAHLVAVAHAT